MSPVREREVEKAALEIYRLPLDLQFEKIADQKWTDEELKHAIAFQRGLMRGQRLSVPVEGF